MYSTSLNSLNGPKFAESSFILLHTMAFKFFLVKVVSVTLEKLSWLKDIIILGTTVEMDHIDVVPHMDRWPSFHNGVAAGLRIPTGQILLYYRLEY